MKKLLFFVFILLTVNQLAQAQTESIDRFVRKYKRAATGDKVDITVPGWLIRFGTNFIKEEDMEGVDIQAIARKISSVRIVSIEGGAKIASADFKSLMDDAKEENFEELLNIRDNGDNIHIMVREKKGLIRDLFIMVQENSGEFVLLDIGGKFTMEDISRAIQDVKLNKEKHKSKSKVTEGL
jgi:Domain of unknown function (DUF4252)